VSSALFPNDEATPAKLIITARNGVVLAAL
jgi:hypothetical protein